LKSQGPGAKKRDRKKFLVSRKQTKEKLQAQKAVPPDPGQIGKSSRGNVGERKRSDAEEKTAPDRGFNARRRSTSQEKKSKEGKEKMSARR